MSIRLPRIASDTVKITCQLDAAVQADLEAYAVAYQAKHGEAIPLAKLIVGIVEDYLQRDQAFMRQRRQAKTTPPPRPAPAASRAGHV